MMFWIDGQLAHPTTEELHLFDPSCLNTFGVFETLRTYNGQIFQKKLHLERLTYSAQLIGMELPYSLPELDEFLESSLKENSETEPIRLKCVATQDHFYVQVLPLLLDPKIYEGVPAIFVHARRAQPKAKSLPYYSSFSAHDSARKKNAYEGILVDSDGTVTEGAYSNIFWVNEGTVFTREDNVLEGITRTIVRQLIPVKWGKITSDELLKADEVFLTKSTTGPVPITSIEGHLIGAGQPGPIYKGLTIKFKQLTQPHE